jgi:hypothetical protein
LCNTVHREHILQRFTGSHEFKCSTDRLICKDNALTAEVIQSLTEKKDDEEYKVRWNMAISGPAPYEDLITALPQ